MFQNIRLTRRGQLVFGSLGAILVALIAWLVIVLAQYTAQANTTADVQLTAVASSYTRVSVQPGDTLWAIAAHHGTSADVRHDVRTIARVNQLSGSTVQVGQTLMVPTRTMGSGG